MNNVLSTKEQNQIGHIILRAALDLQVGKIKLALFLHGSHSQEVKNSELDKKEGYGALFWFGIETIKGFIDQLEEMEFLKTHVVRTGYYSYPILMLSEAGKKILEEDIEIPLQIRTLIKPVRIGLSEQDTLALFKKGIPPPEIARQRSLALSTIFNHFYRLIAIGEISARQCISDLVIKQVLKAKKKALDRSSLKEIKLMLPEEITYEEIRAILADKRLQKPEGENYGQAIAIKDNTKRF